MVIGKPAVLKNNKLHSVKNQKAGAALKKIKALNNGDAPCEIFDIPSLSASESGEYCNDFASALAHEVRNPLSCINLATGLLSDGLKKDSDLKIYVDTIMRNSSRINELIIKFLMHQHCEETGEDSYSVSAILDEVMEMVRDRIWLKNITVIKKFYASDFKAFLNKQKMKIALTNIIINAIDALPSSQGLLKLTGKSMARKYLVTIQDNGCGISKDNLQLIFKAGFTDKPDGSGFGLSITHDFLQSINVGIKVVSKEGKGTCFKLLFNEDLRL